MYKQIGHNVGHRPMMQLYHTPRRFKTNYQVKVLGVPNLWMLQSGFLCLFTFFWIMAPTSDLINKLFPFSLGKPTQGAYYPPHVRYITPYDEIVRNHKREQKRKQEMQEIVVDDE